MNILQAYRCGLSKVNLTKELEDDIQNNGVDIQKSEPNFILNNKDLNEYTDDYLYEFELGLKKLFEEKIKDKHWVNNARNRKYKFSMLVEQIFGRPYDAKLDGGRLSTFRMITHYCSRVTKHYYDPDKDITYNTRGYCLSINRYKKIWVDKTILPFGLRLQAERLRESGIIPTNHNCRRKKGLKSGQARNPRTQENMIDHVDRARKAYYEYQRKYRDNKKQD